MQKKGKQKLCFILVMASLINLLPALTLAAESTITISSTPYLSFLDIPNSVIGGPLTVPVTDLDLLSDPDGPLPPSRSLTVSDNRESGGFILQMDAEPFTPAVSPDLRDNLKIVTSGVSELYSTETPVGGIVYLPADGETSFIGDQAITAPLDAGSTLFSLPSTFTSVGGNTLNTTIDLMDGCLSSGGRKGKMNLHLSYYLILPKYTPPPYTGDQYFTTFTYTLTDCTP